MGIGNVWSLAKRVISLRTLLLFLKIIKKNKMVDINITRGVTQKKVGVNNHLKYAKVVPKTAMQHSVVAKIISKLNELWSEMEALVNDQSKTWSEDKVMKCEYLLPIVGDVLDYCLTKDEVRKEKLIGGKYSFNKIRDLVLELLDLDVAQLKHKIEIVHAGKSEEIEEGFALIDQLVGELQLFTTGA